MNYSLIKQHFNHNAKHMVNLLSLYQELATRLVERLEYIKIQPLKIIDLGSGLNTDEKLIKNIYPNATIYKIDIAVNMLKQYNLLNKNKNFLSKLLPSKNSDLICANAELLPIASQSIDLVWSNLLIPYITNLEQYFKEIRRVLKQGSCFLVSGLGIDSLKELRDAGLHTFLFPDMHTIGDILVNLGFSDIVTDTSYITLEYDNVEQLLADIKLIGCGGGLIKGSSFLTKSSYLTIKEYLLSLINHNNKIPLTLEIFSAHGWKDNINIDLPKNTKIIKFK